VRDGRVGDRIRERVGQRANADEDSETSTIMIKKNVVYNKDQEICRLIGLLTICARFRFAEN
jgi:hypothetical protein